MSTEQIYETSGWRTLQVLQNSPLAGFGAFWSGAKKQFVFVPAAYAVFQEKILEVSAGKFIRSTRLAHVVLMDDGRQVLAEDDGSFVGFSAAAPGTPAGDKRLIALLNLVRARTPAPPLAAAPTGKKAGKTEKAGKNGVKTKAKRA